MRRAPLAIVVLMLLVGPWAGAANDALFSKQWGLHKVGAEQAWGVGTGAGATIAVVDTGVQLDHEDLQANIVGGRNFVEAGQPPADDHGHGTHVAGIAAAVADNVTGVAGTARGAKIMPVRVLRKEANCSSNCGATGSAGAVDQGIRWAADNGATVINLSLGNDLPLVNVATFDLRSALNYAWSKGSVPVIAAGNNSGLSLSLADVNAIVVAATTPTDSQPGYSSGPGDAKWGISAPGGAGGSRADDNIWSAYIGNKYAAMAGTSMAAPHVAGAAAILRSKGLTPQQTVDRLLSTAKPLGPAQVFGAGRLDLAKAVQGLGGSGTGGGGAQPTAASGGAPPPGGSTSRRGRSTTATAAPARGGSPAKAPVPSTETPAPAAPAESPAPTDGATEFAAPRTTASKGSPAGPLAAAGAAVAFLTAGGFGLRRLLRRS